MIYVLDYGSQYSHLITRRIRELGVFAELVPHNYPLSKLQKAKGLVLSGGPQNLSDSRALRIDKRVFDTGIPVLGICYGLQLIAFELGGQVVAGKKREYGPTEIKITDKNRLFAGLKPRQLTWMSHGDQVSKVPVGFQVIAKSQNCPVSGMADESRQIYGLQFHPEVEHTVHGLKILQNFIRITGAKRTWKMTDFVKKEILRIKKIIGNKKAICALSGGVDSAVATSLVRKAIGSRLTSIFVDTGLMRLGEVEEIRKQFPKIIIVDAQKAFLRRLKGVTDPENKRKIIGRLFIRIFEREARRLGNFNFLVQGTLYTDAITSGVSVGNTAAVIKSHHNVGGLPAKMGFRLIEPLRQLYKDEVRKIGKILWLPNSITSRQPFPGPGLAVRIIGEVTEKKIIFLKKADAIVREEIEKAKFDSQQYFAVLPDIKSVGVQGDARTYGYPIIVRAVTTKDFMTAHWAKLPHKLLEKISVRITNEVPGINRVVYDITSKPPGTVEWE